MTGPMKLARSNQDNIIKAPSGNSSQVASSIENNNEFPIANISAIKQNSSDSNKNQNGNGKLKNEDQGGSKSAQALVEVRKRFLEFAAANPDKVNDRDRDKLATDDWYLKRYLLARNRKVNETMKMLQKTMEWRNEFGIHISEDAMFPQEFYKIGALFPYENDKKGNMVLYLRIKYHRKVVEMVEVEKHFLVHTFEKIDRLTNGSGLVIVFDCQGAGYANCDVDFLQFLISCATEHAPVGLQYIIVYKLPWVMNAFWSLARKLLPAYLSNRVRFCDENSIFEFIEPDKLPDFMNGTCRRNFRWIPPGSPSIFKLANAHGITDAEIEKILPQFQQFLDESDEALTNNAYVDPPDTITKYVNNPQTAPSLLSDLALCNIGFGEIVAQSPLQSVQEMNDRLSGMTHAVDTSVLRVFPNQFIEFHYDAYNDAFHGTVTLLNPSKTNSLAFKMMSNRPSSYSVKPARGVLAPNTSITLSVFLLSEQKATDKFLIVAQSLEGKVESITKAQFDSLWSTENARTISHTSIKVGTYLRKVITTPSNQTAVIRSPHVQELATACRSLRRRQSVFLLVNVILLIIIINIILFNQN